MSLSDKKIVFSYFFFAILYLSLISFIDFPVTTILKPLPLICLIVAVLSSQGSKELKVLLLYVLSFSLLGDLALTFPGTRALYWGIGFFILAHCGYIMLFFRDSLHNWIRVLYFLPVLIFIVVVFCYIAPYVGDMLFAVIVYLCVLSLMVLNAFQVKNNAVMIACGALIFLLSDLILALNLFVITQINLEIPIMLAYYWAQLILVMGLLSVKN